MIPRRIYNIWFGKSEMPEDRKKYIAGWKELNPDYDVITITEDNFNIEKYPFIQAAIKYKKWAFASDMARLIVIYENGGFYLDNDVELIKPLSKLESYESVWAIENSDAINPGLMLGAQKDDKNLKDLIEIYKHLDFTPGHDDDYIIVPIVTEYFRKLGFKYTNKSQKLAKNIMILSSEYFAPLHWWGGGKITNHTIGIHQYGASWKKDWNISLKTKVLQNLIYYMPFLGVPLKEIRNKFK